MNLWLLADETCMPCLQNLAMHKIGLIHGASGTIPTLTFQRIYDSTPVDNPLRRYAIQAAASLSIETFTETPERFPHEMLIDLIAFNAERRDICNINYEDFYVKVVKD